MIGVASARAAELVPIGIVEITEEHVRAVRTDGPVIAEEPRGHAPNAQAMRLVRQHFGPAVELRRSVSGRRITVYRLPAPAPAVARTGQLTPMQYAQAIGLAYLAAPHGSDEESELHRALGAACDRLGLDVAEILCGLKEQHGESITVEDAS